MRAVLREEDDDAFARILFGLESLSASSRLAGSRLHFPFRDKRATGRLRTHARENRHDDVSQALQYADAGQGGLPTPRSCSRADVCLRPTVYDFAHIGNARAAIVFDVLFRLLRQAYGEANVVYTATSRRRRQDQRARAADFRICLQRGDRARHRRDLRQYREDVAAVGCLPPTHEPRATAHLDEMRR